MDVYGYFFVFVGVLCILGMGWAAIEVIWGNQ